MNFDMKAFGEKAKGFIKTAGERAVKATKEARERADRAAEAVAVKVTEVTGRETTATEVKRAAVIAAGAVVLATTGAAIVGSHRGLVATALNAGNGNTGSAWGSDFESQAARVFAENGGSLNYYTPHVDSTGTVYYEPNG